VTAKHFSAGLSRIAQKLFARFDGHLLVSVELEMPLRMPTLRRRMQRIAGDHRFRTVVADKDGYVPGRMPWRRDQGDMVAQLVARRDQFRLARLDHWQDAFSVAVDAPLSVKLIIRRRKQVAGVGKGWSPPAIHQLRVPADMIGVKMRAKDVIHILSPDARRGQATANQVYGNAIAVLSGDFCVGRALRLAFQEGGGDCALRLAATVEEMAEGEVLQLQRAGQVDADRAGYLEVANRKSASLIAWCAMAPALRDGLAEEAAALEAYGRNVGLAFQVADDILDFSPDTGKTPGADLRERKVTLPILHAFERLPTLKDRLRGELSDADILELVDEVVASGALEAAREEAFRWIAEARQALQALPEGPGRDALDAVAGFVAERMK